MDATLEEVGTSFLLDDLGEDVFKRSYAATEDETWELASFRVAEHVSAAENPELKQKWTRRFYKEILENRFMPGGRIWYGSGRPKGQLLNCFVIPAGDSREGWGDLLKESLIISGTGGGVGINFSAVRPRGSEIKGTGGHATGPVSLMRMDNEVGHELVAGGGRRMAKMSCLNVTHPDIWEFLNSKLKDGQLSNTNISVIINFDHEDFVKLVKEDGEIELEWAGRKTGKTVKAKELWNTIVENAWNNGEPGVLNGFMANKENNIYYHKPLVSTNPCGEIWLEPYGCCCLGALVLPRFVEDGKVNWETLEESIRIAVRFLDNVLTVNHYPFEKIKDNCEEVRRIGLGVMGLHTMLLELGIKYSSQEAFDFTDRLFSFIKHVAYDTSIALAIEKGPFPAFKPEFVDSGFMKTMKPAIRRKVKEYGIRNCALLTVAPTGTTGIVSGVSTGIEPYMAPVYFRRIKTVNESLKTVIEKVLVVEPAYEKFGDLCEGAADISVDNHFKMQATVQKHIDNAVSKTINLANDFPMEDLSDIWLKYLPQLKGTTFYRDGSREDQPIEPVLLKDIPNVLESTPEDKIKRKERNGNEADCLSGVCEIPAKFEIIIGTTLAHGGPHYPGCGHPERAGETEIMSPEVYGEARKMAAA
jgi:ribonucleoside-diphosphate reductase alpha chain